LNDRGRNFAFDFDNSGTLIEFIAADQSADIFDSCQINGTASVLAATALYAIEAELTECDDPEANGDYTGLITLRSSGGDPDDQLVLIFSDGVRAGAGVFEEDEL
jgi:hypothetical protein